MPTEACTSETVTGWAVEDNRPVLTDPDDAEDLPNTRGILSLNEPKNESYK